MFKMIEHPADYEIRTFIRFLNARKIKPADIHRQLCELYGEGAISDGMLRRWVRKFNESRVSVLDEQRSSAGKGAVVARASLRPPVNRSSDVFMHCGCAELICECQLHNGMDIFCLFRERI